MGGGGAQTYHCPPNKNKWGYIQQQNDKTTPKTNTRNSIKKNRNNLKKHKTHTHTQTHKKTIKKRTPATTR